MAKKNKEQKSQEKKIEVDIIGNKELLGSSAESSEGEDMKDDGTVCKICKVK